MKSYKLKQEKNHNKNSVSTFYTKYSCYNSHLKTRVTTTCMYMWRSGLQFQSGNPELVGLSPAVGEK